MASAARDALDAKKGEDILVLDVRKLTTMTDYCILVSGNSPPHLKALTGEVVRALKNAGIHCYRRAGDPESGWMALDYVDVVVHALSREARAYYAFESLWADAPRVP